MYYPGENMRRISLSAEFQQLIRPRNFGRRPARVLILPKKGGHTDRILARAYRNIESNPAGIARGMKS